MDSKLEQYERKKIALVASLKTLVKESPEQNIALHKDTSNLFRKPKTKKLKIDVRHFNQVISVDPVNNIAEVEGMTTYEALVDECLKYNRLPTVVPELKTITIGGALSGVGIESSSFRYGLVHETLLSYDILLGDGRVIECTPDNEHSDLFYGFPNTYGSLGYALKVKVKLIPVKNFVKLTHVHFSNAKDYFAALEKYCAGANDFVDGVVFDKNDLVITLGQWVDQAPYVSNYKYLNIYYRSLQQKTGDYLTTKDYIWRWDTDWFWCSKFFYMQNFLMRLLFGRWVLNSKTFWKIRKKFSWHTRKNKETIIQDIEVPVENAEAFLDFFHKHIGIKPIWICPTKPYKKEVVYDFYAMQPDKLFINFGFWDVIPSTKADGYFNKMIEQKVAELAGHKSLYSNVYYTEAEFWTIFDKIKYQALKQKYDANYRLRSWYEKCAKEMET